VVGAAVLEEEVLLAAAALLASGSVQAQAQGWRLVRGLASPPAQGPASWSPPRASSVPAWALVS
jgi:hypothetical protein